MNVREKHHLTITAVVLVLVTALIDPIISAATAAALLVTFVVWEWVEMRRAARRPLRSRSGFRDGIRFISGDSSQGGMPEMQQ